MPYFLLEMPYFAYFRCSTGVAPSLRAVVLPLLEKEAEMIYYCHILQKNKRELKPFWERYL